VIFVNVFDVFIYAIAAVVFVALFFAVVSFFIQSPNNSKIISSVLDTAVLSNNLGSALFVGYLDFPKDSSLESSDFVGITSSVSFECVSPNDCCARDSDLKGKECLKPFSWDYSFLKVNESKKANVFVRCSSVNEALFCKVFFGSMPAQASIESLELVGVNSSGGQDITLSVKNTGSIPLAFGKSSVVLFKKAYGKWERTDFVSEPKEVEVIQAGEKYKFYWTLSLANPGEYRAEFNFEGQNAGFSKKSIDFNKTLSLCSAISAGEAVFDPEQNKYLEMRSCEGCTYAFECVSAWSAADSSTVFYPSTKDFAYCVKDSPDGSC